MIPSEIAEKLVSLGICYQTKVEQVNFLEKLAEITQPPKEDFSEVGFNDEHEDEDKPKKQPEPKAEIVLDKKELLTYDGWHLAIKPPTKVKPMIRGPLLTAYIDSRRRLNIRGDDIPYCAKGIELKFNSEYILDIQLANKVLVIITIFGQTAIRLPDEGP